VYCAGIPDQPVCGGLLGRALATPLKLGHPWVRPPPGSGPDPLLPSAQGKTFWVYRPGIFTVGRGAGPREGPTKNQKEGVYSGNCVSLGPSEGEGGGARTDHSPRRLLCAAGRPVGGRFYWGRASGLSADSFFPLRRAGLCRPRTTRGPLPARGRWRGRAPHIRKKTHYSLMLFPKQGALVREQAGARVGLYFPLWRGAQKANPPHPNPPHPPGPPGDPHPSPAPTGAWGGPARGAAWLLASCVLLCSGGARVVLFPAVVGTLRR